MNEVGVQAINDFLPACRVLSLLQTNIGSEKKFSDDQKRLKNNLKLEKSTLKYIYSSKYMQYFYTDEEISAFIEKWVSI